jgi:hypothetical protein
MISHNPRDGLEALSLPIFDSSMRVDKKFPPKGFKPKKHVNIDIIYSDVGSKFLEILLPSSKNYSSSPIPSSHHVIKTFFPNVD